ncbi:MAG: prolyl oligopeptidase family serine peptidase [Sedimentisphaerales bacterium]|nr:prolyl oligopeptidase family serine peptidase [Sedimentisphaerales bacterium]
MRMRRSSSVIVTLLLLLVQCGFGQSVSGKLNHDGLERSYVIHVPNVMDPNVPMPLLIALHGAGSGGADFEELTGFSQLSNREGFIVVYPNSTSARGRQWNAMWNWGQKPDDSGFISTLIDVLMKQYSLDSQRIFVTGHSVGAFMAYRLANEYPEKISAVAVNGGLVGLKKLEAGSPVSIMHIHGKDDTKIPFTGMPQYSYPGVDEGLEWWIQRNGCISESETSRMNSNITIKKWSSPHGVGDVMLYLIDGFGHDWPKVTNTAGIDVSTVMWEFFKNHPKSGSKPNEDRITWIPRADLPLPLSPNGVCALNGKIYLIGGRQNAIQKDVDFTLEYDPQMDRWTKKTNLPFKSHLHNIVPLGGKIYLFSSDMQNNLVYDPRTDSWEPIASNTDKRIPGPCVAYRGKIYVMGGIRNIIFDLSDRIDVYDPETNSWLQNKPMQNVRLGLCVAVEDKILVIGGWQPVAGQKRVQSSRTVQVYDPINERWENKSDLPFGLVGSAVAVGAKVYVMGCSTGEIPGQTKDLTTVLVYDVSNDIWQTTTPLPRLAVGAGFVVLDESIYLIGGCAGQQHGWSDYASTFKGEIVK